MTYWKGKVVVVTGASAGLGRVIADTFGRAGASVVLAARNPEKLQEAAGEIRRHGHAVLTCPTDITQDDQVGVLFQRTHEELGRIDALINCAGKSSRGAILETSPEAFRDLWELNFLALVRCTRACMPYLLASKGHVVNVGSLAAKSTSRYLGAYPASKFPVAAYSQQLRLELTERGVHTLLVCPGPIRREDTGHRYADRDVPESAQQPGGGVRLKGIDADWLAQRILRACERRQAELVVPRKAKILFTLSQIAPSWGDWLIDKMTRSSQR